MNNKKDSIDKLYYLKNRSLHSFNTNLCLCQCECDCHKKIKYRINKNRTQINLNNRILNYDSYQQKPPKSISKNITNLKKYEYTFDPTSITNSTEPNQNITISTNKRDLNINNSNNGYLLYRNDIKDFSLFLNALHKIKEKNIRKSSSFKGINTNKFFLIKNNENINKNLELKNDIPGYNNKSYNDKIKKNMSLIYKNDFSLTDIIKNDDYLDKMTDSKRTFQLYTDNYIKNKPFITSKQKINNINNENYFYSINMNNNILNKSYQVNNNKLISKKYDENWNINSHMNNNYNNKTNYILEEKFNTNEVYRKSPLGHIVDNFVTMLKDKNKQRNKMLKKNIIKSQNYLYNKYNEDIMIKKKKLDDICLNSNKLKSDYSSHDIKKKIYLLEKSKKRIFNQRKNHINERNNKINRIKEIQANNRKKENNNKINENFNFSFNNKNFNNQMLLGNEKKSKNNPYLSKENSLLNKSKHKIENSNELFKNSFINYVYRKKETIKSEIQKKRVKMKDIYKNNIQYNAGENKITKGKNNKKNNKDSYIKKKNICKNLKYIENKNNKLKIERFNILIKDKDENRDKNISLSNEISFNNKSVINKRISPSKFEKNIEIQNISNITYSPKINLLISKEGLEQSQKILNRSKNIGETVAEKIRKLIIKKASQNQNRSSLSTKLNINTDLALTDSEKSEKEYTDKNMIKRNIKISSKTVFCVYYEYNKLSILAFDYDNKTFSFHDFSDFGNFEENYKLSLNNDNRGNIFLNVGKYLYIITGKNYDMLYSFDSKKKTMNKLCKLNNNHSNGNLIYYENNLVCISGDFNKSVEIYNIEKNIWKNMSEMIKERSCSGVVILNNKYIINLFGYNWPTKKYLDNIEYFDKNNKLNSSWKLIECKNFTLRIKNFFCINNNNKIIIVGGSKYNENDKLKVKYNNNFIKIIFLGKNIDNENNVKIEELIGKMKDINKNKSYLFLSGAKKIEDKQNIYYEVFDNKYNCHIFKGSSNSHDIFYAHF